MRNTNTIRIDPQPLSAWRRLGISSTTDYERFNHVTRTAAIALNVSTAAISIGDHSRQVVLCHHGSIPLALPHEAISQSDLFIVEDTLKNSHFAQHVSVTQSPHIQFYAGLPLLSLDGEAVGTLWVTDKKTRQFDRRSVELLRGFGNWAQSELAMFERERIRVQTNDFELLAPAIHLIRGTLTSIHGFSDVLLEQECAPEERQELLEIIHEKADHTVFIIRELVELFQAETIGGQDFQLAPQPLAPLVRNSVAAANIKKPIEMAINEELTLVFIDPDRFQQAMVQLLTASKDPATNDVSGIAIRRAAESEFVSIEIAYSSDLIETDEIERIFEPYFWTQHCEEPTNRCFGPTLAKKTIEFQGGQVFCNRDANFRTTRISVLLPIHAESTI